MIAKPWIVLVYIKVYGWLEAKWPWRYFWIGHTWPDNKNIYGALKRVGLTSPNLLVSHLKGVVYPAHNASRYL